MNETITRDTLLETLEVGRSTKMAFKSNKFKTVGDILDYGIFNLIRLHGFGPVALNEILTVLYGDYTTYFGKDHIINLPLDCKFRILNNGYTSIFDIAKLSELNIMGMKGVGRKNCGKIVEYIMSIEEAKSIFYDSREPIFTLKFGGDYICIKIDKEYVGSDNLDIPIYVSINSVADKDVKISTDKYKNIIIECLKKCLYSKYSRYTVLRHIILSKRYNTLKDLIDVLNTYDYEKFIDMYHSQYSREEFQYSAYNNYNKFTVNRVKKHYGKLAEDIEVHVSLPSRFDMNGCREFVNKNIEDIRKGVIEELKRYTEGFPGLYKNDGAIITRDKQVIFYFGLKNRKIKASNTTRKDK